MSAVLRPLQLFNLRLHHLAEQLLEPQGRYAAGFENLIVGLIVFSVASIGVEAMPQVPQWLLTVLRVAEVVVVAVFSFEYLLRIVAAPKKLAFIVSFQGVVDLLAIAPFFLIGLDARWLRALRLLRLLRLLKLQTHFLEHTVAERTRELAQKNAALLAAQAQLKAEIDLARAMQIAILPAGFPDRPGCEAAACMIPATTMGGDFYDFMELPGGEIGLVMADVSGHGVPAAFFMAVARTNLRELAPHCPDPGTCLNRTNEVLCTQNPMDLFVTVFYCMLNTHTGLLRYANAGHNPPYLRRADGSVHALDGAGGLVLGAMADSRFETHSLQLLPGDRVVLFTDGVTEAFNSTDEAYGVERLIAEVKAYDSGAASGLIDRIRNSVTRFAGDAPQSDDIALSVLTWRDS
ncbi:MAG: SpoIIE family protein phosphatase [Proteobacteria bacterium]|nr:SpoIIE family protein phosphatase [Pseudomonadota bacterium]